MSKVLILWFNFSLSTSYPHGPVSSGMSIEKAELLDTDIGESEGGMCNCGCLRKRSINISNNHVTNLVIKNIRTINDNRSALDDLLDINIFYRLLRDIISDKYHNTFILGDVNMAVFLNNDETFDDLVILEKFKARLVKYYNFEAPIDMSAVDVFQNVNSIPFMNIDDETINMFIKWASKFY